MNVCECHRTDGCPDLSDYVGVVRKAWKMGENGRDYRNLAGFHGISRDFTGFQGISRDCDYVIDLYLPRGFIALYNYNHTAYISVLLSVKGTM